jgi:hypothetical protein
MYPTKAVPIGIKVIRGVEAGGSDAVVHPSGEPGYPARHAEQSDKGAEAVQKEEQPEAVAPTSRPASRPISTCRVNIASGIR